VITTEDLGRPAETIDHYSEHAHALYLTDLKRWRVAPADAARALSAAGMPPYLLLARVAPARMATVRDLAAAFTLEPVGAIPPAHALRYFVEAPAGRGGPLDLYRLVPREG
jgi:hypothetical protein